MIVYVEWEKYHEIDIIERLDVIEVFSVSITILENGDWEDLHEPVHAYT